MVRRAYLLPAAIAATALLSPVAGFAASGTQGRAAESTATSQNAPDAKQIVKDATGAVGQAKADAEFRNLMAKAKGVFVVPNMVKGAAVIGGEGGQGVLLAHRNATWSEPAFLSVGSISLGAQVGGKAGSVIMLLMSDKALNDFIDASNFSLNANAGLTIINYSARGQAGVGKGDIIVWSGAGGAFVGASISASDITANTREDQNFYGRPVTTKQIIEGRIQSTAADALRTELPG